MFYKLRRQSISFCEHIMHYHSVNITSHKLWFTNDMTRSFNNKGIQRCKTNKITKQLKLQHKTVKTHIFKNKCELNSHPPSRVHTVASTRVQGWGMKHRRCWGVGKGCSHPHWWKGLPTAQKICCFVILKWYILVNSEVLNLKYVIILREYSHWCPLQPSPNQNIRGCVPGVPSGVDTSESIYFTSNYTALHCIV